MYGGIEMKKYLYAFVGLCLCQSVYADPHGVYDSTHVTGIVIPRPILVDVLIQDDLISQTAGAYENMLAKYDRLAGPFGQEQLSIDDITQICVASGVINTKEECFTRVLNPAFTKMGRVRFFDTCSGRITGGTNYCIDDVFQIGRSENGNPYHQDVDVSRNPAFGFAIEYAKKNGHDVWCSSETHDQAINCSTLDNQNFYTFKFAGLNNTSDSALIPSLGSTSKNLIKGICALYDAEYSIGRISWDCKFDCRNGTDASKVIPKFGLSIHPASTENECMLSVPDLSPANVKKYPGYEYMTYAFKEIQTVLEPSLTKVLKTYVELQGISVQSFDCDYSPRAYNDEIQSGAWQGMPVSVDDALRCRINGTEVDFIFDDLFESKGYEQRAGQAGLQCILAGGNYGSDKNCRNLTRAQCTEANAVVPGGTDWDARAEVCILRDAARARTISNTIQITGGVVLAVGITVASGGSATVALVAAAGSVVVDAAFIGYERLLVLNPAHRARQFADDVKYCHIPIEKTSCTPEQKTCSIRVINEHFARLDEIMDQLHDDQLVVIGDLMENVADCLSDEELKSALTTSTPMFEDKLLSAGGSILMVASVFFSPENAFMKLSSKAPKLIRVLTRCKVAERVSSSLDNARYIRIYVDRLDANDIDRVIDELQRKRMYISSNMTEDGRRFIGVADENIFGRWDNVESNWLARLGRVSGVSDNGNIVRRTLQEIGYDVNRGPALNMGDIVNKWGGDYFLTNGSIDVAKLNYRVGDLDYAFAGYFDDEIEMLTKIQNNNLEDVFRNPNVSQSYKSMLSDYIAERKVAMRYISQYTSARDGRLLLDGLSRRYPHGKVQNGFFYIGTNAQQHMTGLKFHVSVGPNGLERATDIINELMQRHGIANEFKVYLYATDPGWAKQIGKEFTIYVSRDGYNASRIESFLRDLESRLRMDNIVNNGFGPNVINGDRRVAGSSYISYRYDRTNNMGIPDGVYNGSYQFVAPRPEYGGDIMDGIRVY